MPSILGQPEVCASTGTRTSSLSLGLSVLAAERDGIARLEEVYSTDPVAQKGFEAATSILVSTAQANRSIIVSGVGKSGLIGKKIVATLNSLGLRSFWLHPTEALHGDLGMIGPHDALILITFSGHTAELLSLVCHLPATSSLILMSSARPDPGAPIATMPLFAARVNAPADSNVLLPTPIPIPEKVLFGVSAPTVSTTTTLALGDALAMAAAHKLHETQEGVKQIFHRYHPGGAIGRAAVTDVSSELATAPGAISPSDVSGPSSQTQSLEGSTIGDDSDPVAATLPKSPVGDDDDEQDPVHTDSPTASLPLVAETKFLRLTLDGRA